jgi:Na+-translocating ferredoxin:NAD+ oxidoreductase subunit D
MKASLLTVGMAPHRHAGRSAGGMIRLTFLGLLPVIIAALYLYRGKALAILAVSVIAAVGTEAAITAIVRQPLRKLTNGHAALLGTLLALVMPAGVALWIVGFAAALCIALGKMVFGNAWNYPFHPVLVALVLVQISWPDGVDNHLKPLPMLDEGTTGETATVWQSAAAPLAAVKVLPRLAHKANIDELVWGDHPGAIGVTSVIAIALGGLILLGLRVIPWQIPLGFLGAAWLVAAIFYRIDPGSYPPPAFTLCAGALFFAAFFLATEWATSPSTGWGMLLYGVGAGALTCIIRYWGGAVEGAFFAILIMNAAAPLLDRITPVPFGRRLKANA